MKSSTYYFLIQTKLLADFQICISVPLSTKTLSYDVKSHPLTININLFKQINLNQMFEKTQMFLMMKTSISNNFISRLNKRFHIPAYEQNILAKENIYIYLPDDRKIIVVLTILVIYIIYIYIYILYIYIYIYLYIYKYIAYVFSSFNSLYHCDNISSGMPYFLLII